MAINPMTVVGGDFSIDELFDSYETIATGRSGLKLILDTLRGDMNPTALLPSYLCGSILQAFQACNISVSFYRVRSDLSIDIEDLVRQFENIKPGVLLFINYFGFPVGVLEQQIIRELKSACWVIEDCVQGSLIEQASPVVGNLGHFVLTSFRKYLFLPDGGLVLSRTNHNFPKLPPAQGNFVTYRLLGKHLRYLYLNDSLSLPEFEIAFLNLFEKAEQELDAQIPLMSMSVVSRQLLSQVCLNNVICARRRNFSILLDRFVQQKTWSSIGVPVFPGLPEGVSPLAFPIQIDGRIRNRIRQKLMDMNVFCPIHWHLPEEIQSDHFVESKLLSEQILSIPIDQRYTPADMQEMVKRLHTCFDEV